MNEEKIKQFVIKLLKMTDNLDLEWEAITPREVELLNGEVILDKVYITDLNGNKFRLYRYKFRNFYNEEEYFWSESVRLEMIDKNMKTEYEFVYNNSMSDLYDMVRERTSNILNVIDDILGINLEIIAAEYRTKEAGFDVTEQLRHKIKNNALKITVNNNLAGDPHPNTPKILKVKYKINDEVFEKTVKEHEILKLP